MNGFLIFKEGDSIFLKDGDELWKINRKVDNSIYVSSGIGESGTVYKKVGINKIDFERTYREYLLNQIL